MERDGTELEAAGAGGQGGDVMHDIFLQVSMVHAGLPGCSW